MKIKIKSKPTTTIIGEWVPGVLKGEEKAHTGSAHHPPTPDPAEPAWRVGPRALGQGFLLLLSGTCVPAGMEHLCAHGHSGLLSAGPGDGLGSFSPKATVNNGPKHRSVQKT